MHLLRILCADYNMDIEDGWNTPFSFARILYDAHAESVGDTSIAKPEHEALADENIAKGIDVEHPAGVN